MSEPHCGNNYVCDDYTGAEDCQHPCEWCCREDCPINAAKCDQCDQLRERRDELLALVRRMTTESVTPEETEEQRGQIAALIAEVGTLRSSLAEAECARLISFEMPRGIEDVVDSLYSGIFDGGFGKSDRLYAGIFDGGFGSLDDAERDRLRDSAAKWDALSWLSQKLTDPEVRKGYVEEAVTAAVENERDDCAELADERADIALEASDWTGQTAALDIRDAIRARGPIAMLSDRAITAAVENERREIMQIVRRYAMTGSGDAADLLEALRARELEG